MVMGHALWGHVWGRKSERFIADEKVHVLSNAGLSKDEAS